MIVARCSCKSHRTLMIDYGDRMQPKNELKNELIEIRRQLEAIGHKEVLDSLSGNDKDENAKNLLKILELVIKENIETRRALNNISDKIAEMENLFFGDDAYDASQYTAQQGDQSQQRKPVPLSDQDSKVIQFVQLNNGMACADDIKSYMNYRGRNAASARLKRLQALGLLNRMQVGHKVYYQFDAGKATNLLIVSPPQ